VCDAYGRYELGTKYYFENLKGRDHLEGVGIGGRITIKSILTASPIIFF
jgi:hypothetical protein